MSWSDNIGQRYEKVLRGRDRALLYRLDHGSAPDWMAYTRGQVMWVPAMRMMLATELVRIDTARLLYKKRGLKQ